MATGNFSSGGSRPVLSEINVTPFVDVMLVLLVIFMITAPILYQGVNVNLPDTAFSPTPVKSHRGMTVTLSGSRDIYLEDRKYPLSQIATALAKSMEAAGTDPRTEKVFLRADRSVRYGFVVRVMDEIRKTGVEKLHLVTEIKDGAGDAKADM